MPSQVRIISPRNSREWDDLVTASPLRQEHTYGGIGTQERADEIRRKIRTAAKRRGDLAAKVYWYACEEPGRCKFGSDCTHHVSFTLYPLAEGQAYKAQQAGKSR